MYKVIVFVPHESKEVVKEAMFNAGGGRIGNYDHCCFESEGIGQFRPLEGSNPAIGAKGQVEYVKEVKVEMVVSPEFISAVLNAMKESHPYEEVAYDVFKHASISS